MDSLEQAYIQVVEAGSFKKAAEYLRVEPSSLSRKVAALEQRLKVKLLNRSTAKTRPTELGKVYYEGLRRIFDEKLALEEEITNNVTTLKGKLRIGSTADLGEQFIVPVIREMQKQAPNLSVELILSSEVDSLVEKNLDVAIRIGPLPDSSLIAKPLADIPRILVASPFYLKAQGTPQTPDDLINHNFVLYSPGQGKVDIAFSDGTKFPHSKITSNVSANSLRAIRALVRDDAGIHWGPQWLYRDDLESGSLIRLLPTYPLKGLSVNAVYPARTFLPQKTKDFIQRISEKILQKT